MTGICVATFFPLVMTAAYDPSLAPLTLLIPLGGLFGYLPDFLDFKLSRYVERTDYIASPGYHDLDPWRVANTIAKCINEAYKSEHPVKLKLHTIRMPNGLWRRYSLLFRLEAREVWVKIGPLITTGLEVVPGSEPEEERVAVVKYKPKLNYSYEDVTNVDIWDGPTFEFSRRGDEVQADFIQWHRRWSHSLTLGLLLGFVVAGLAGLIYYFQGINLTDIEILTVFGIVAGGIWGHVLVDQLGWLGSNLFWPVTGRRKTGVGLTRSMDPLANFVTTYILTLLIVWNMNRFAPEPVFAWTNLEFFLLWIVLPMAILIALTLALRKKKGKTKRSKEEEAREEVSMEIAYF